MNQKNMLAVKLRELGELSDYKGQAEHFLKITGAVLYIVKAVPQTSPHWAPDGKHGTCYSVHIGKYKEAPSATVSYFGSYNDNRMHYSKEIQFFFWSSIATKEAGSNSAMGEKKPTAYNVLANLYMPADNFEEFCANLGYDTDSQNAEKTFHEVQELNAKLESIFTAEELEALGEI